MDEPEKVIAENEKYADYEDKLTSPRSSKTAFCSNRSDRIHMDFQQNNKDNQQRAVIERMKKHKK